MIILSDLQMGGSQWEKWNKLRKWDGFMYDLFG